jgi:hypothetical protein
LFHRSFVSFITNVRSRCVAFVSWDSMSFSWISMETSSVIRILSQQRTSHSMNSRDLGMGK